MLLPKTMFKIVFLITLINALLLALAKFDLFTVAMFGTQMIIGTSFYCWIVERRKKYKKTESGNH